MNASPLHIILTIFILSCLFAAWRFMLWQQRGRSFVDSFDHAIAQGGVLLATGSALAILMSLGGLAPA